MAPYLDGGIWTFSFVTLTYVHYWVQPYIIWYIFSGPYDWVIHCSFLDQTYYKHASLEFVDILLCFEYLFAVSSFS